MRSLIEDFLLKKKNLLYEEGRRVALQHYQPHNCRHHHHRDRNHHISHHQDHVCAGKLKTAANQPLHRRLFCTIQFCFDGVEKKSFSGFPTLDVVTITHNFCST